MELIEALEKMDADPTVRVFVLTGSERAFAAGADIAEMQPKSFTDVYVGNMFGGWPRFNNIAKPIIGAVNGFALGATESLPASRGIDHLRRRRL